MYIAFGALFSMSSLAVGLSYLGRGSPSVIRSNAEPGPPIPIALAPAQSAVPALQPIELNDNSENSLPRAPAQADQSVHQAGSADIAELAPEPVPRDEPALGEPDSPAGRSSPVEPVLGDQDPAAQGEDHRAEIKDTILKWADVWSSQDVGGYFSFYADDFWPAYGSRADWQNRRASRIRSPRRIQVRLDDIRIHAWDGEVATVMFDQLYASNRIEDRSRKVLIMIRRSDAWRIASEIVLSSTKVR